MAWNELINSTVTRGDNATIPPLIYPSMATRRVAIFVQSQSARWTWKKACDVVMLVQYPVQNAPLLELYRATVELNQHEVIDLPYYRPATAYTLKIEFPDWFVDVSIGLWAASGDDDPLQYEGVRSPGFLQSYAGIPPIAGYLLDFDGYWLCLSLDSIRTIGNAQSGANVAQSWLERIFGLLWASFSNARCPMLSSGGQAVARGASANDDWMANKRLTLPDYRGRSLLSAGSGGNLNSRYKGDLIGAETHTLTINEMPVHRHVIGNMLVENLSGAYYATTNSGSRWKTQLQTDPAGGGLPHNNMPPVAVEHLFISCGSK